MKPSPDQAHIREWLRVLRGGETQDALAQDIERVTKWHIPRDRYSKYESGAIRIGPTVLGHFVDYWASRDKPGPESMASSGATPPQAAPELADLITAINALVKEMKETREADQTRQREEIAIAVREAVEPLLSLYRAGSPPQEGQAHGGATRAMPL